MTEHEQLAARNDTPEDNEMVSTAVAERVEPEAQPTVSEAVAIMHVIERAAMNPNVDIDKMRQLMEMRDQAEAKAALRQFDIAMSEAQSELRAVVKDAPNEQTKSRYASYSALDKAVRPIYTKHGFSLSFNTGDGAPEQCVRVLCRVAHREGYGRDYHIDMPADGKGAKGGDVMTKTHATGSAVSYGMRYLLKMIFNIATGDDDDGNAAGVEYVTEEQAENILRIAEEVGANLPIFCKFLKIPNIPALPAARYPEAIKRLEQKAAQK